MKRKIIGMMLAVSISAMLTACGAGAAASADGVNGSAPTTEEMVAESVSVTEEAAGVAAGRSGSVTGTVTKAAQSGTVEQDADDIDESFTLADNGDITITSAGTYLIEGQAKNVTVFVDAGDDDEVVILLSGAEIINEDLPCIEVKNAKKTAVKTAAGTTSTLEVSGAFKEDGDDNADAVIYSRDDLVLKGEGTLVIRSSEDAVCSNDDLKVKSGEYRIDCAKNAFKAHDEIEVEDGTITVNSCHDGFHAEDNDDDTKGSILITGGTITVTAEDDAIHATTTVQIDDGMLVLTGAECIEATQITINGGDISITASGDGINAAAKSASLTPTFTLNGGKVVISMGAGDTDGVDSNGNIYINGGTIDITGQSAFDYDGEATFTGGTIIVNGEETDTITNQFMGGPGGGRGGMMQAPNGQQGAGGMMQAPNGQQGAGERMQAPNGQQGAGERMQAPNDRQDQGGFMPGQGQPGRGQRGNRKENASN